MIAVRIALGLLAAAVASGEVQAAENLRGLRLPRVISHSRQFSVFADDDLLASTLAAFAERVKRDWLQRLDLSDAWRDPIVLVVRERSDADGELPAVSLSSYRTDIHLKYQIDIRTPPAVSVTNLLPAVVEALCAELANRDVPLAYGQPYVPAAIPAWLRDGLSASLVNDPATLATAVRERCQSGAWPTAQAVLSGDCSDDVTASWLLVEALLALPQGPSRLQQFLKALPDKRDTVGAFWDVYGVEFATGRALEKWWAVQLLRRATATVAQNWSAADTRNQLNALLITRVRQTEGSAVSGAVLDLAFEQLWRYADAPWFDAVVRNKQMRLDLLWAQGHPLYRPVVAHYRAALEFLQAGSARRFRREIRTAQSEQAKAEARLAAIANHVAAVEAQLAPAQFDATFRDYFDIVGELEQLRRQRRSPITDYLNQFER